VKARTRGLARRYARALVDVALGTGEAEAVGSDLRSAVTIIEGHAELKAVLMHRALSAERKRRIVAGLWKQGLVARLLAMLAERNRMELLPAIRDEFEKAWNQSRGVASADALTAIPLAESQAQALREALGKILGLALELKVRVDPRVLGGVRVSVGGRTYDGTVRTRLRNLRDRLAVGGA
jgi:F-type H+-transporting ATPase subunit delta